MVPKLLRLVILFHQVFNPRFRASFMKHLPHDRIFVFIFELIAAELNIDVRLTATLAPHLVEFLTAPTQGQIAHGLPSGIEVLVKPFTRWNHETARSPIEALDLLPLGPEKRVAVTTQDDDVRSGSVKMSFLVRADGKLRDMSAQRVLG